MKSSLGELVRKLSNISAKDSCRHFFQKVVCGDSRQVEPYHSLLFDHGTSSLKSADAIVTDPPYCLLTRRRKGGDVRDFKATRNSKLDGAEEVPRFENVREFSTFTNKWMETALKFAKPTAILIVWTNALGKQPILATAKQLRCDYIGEYVWAKRAGTKDLPVSSTKNEVLLRVYESALVFRRIPVSVVNHAPKK